MQVSERRQLFWPKDFREQTSWMFFRNRIGFTFGLDVFISLLITLLLGSWRELLPSFVYAQCIGFTILTLISYIYFPASKYFQLGYAWQIALYVVLAPLGIVGGFLLGLLITGGHLSSVDGKVTALSLISEGHFRWLTWAVPVVFSLIGAVIAYLYNIGRALVAERQQQAEEAERAAVEAQLKVLQAQIEPHFLFNTLATLDALITTDRDQARAMLQHLIRYLRAALTHSRAEQATLGSEVELLKAYLSIMQLRLPNRLQLQLACDPACDQLVIAPMLLQPLVENAITHGIEPSRDGGTIRINTTCKNAMLEMSIEDTGVGLGHSPTAGTGTGVDNVRQRLVSLYGVAATLVIEPLAPHGTRALIRIPLTALSKLAS